MNLAAGCHVRGTKNKIRDKTKVPRRDKSRFDFEEVARKVAEQRRFVSAVTEYAELDKETKKVAEQFGLPGFAYFIVAFFCRCGQ